MKPEPKDCNIPVLFTQTHKAEMARICAETGESRSALVRRAVESLPEYRGEK